MRPRLRLPQLPEKRMAFYQVAREGDDGDFDDAKCHCSRGTKDDPFGVWTFLVLARVELLFYKRKVSIPKNTTTKNLRLFYRLCSLKIRSIF